MSVLGNIGNFFKGAFTDTDEEKRRRQQQQAQAQAAQQKQQSQQAKTVQQLFTPQQNQDIKVTPNAPTKPIVLQQSKPTVVPIPVAKPAPVVVAQPKVNQPAPANGDMQFKDYRKVGEKQKTIFGKNAAWALPKSLETVDQIKVDQNVTTNKDKYVAAFDKLDDEHQKILVNAAKEQASKGDKASQNTLTALHDSGRLKGDVFDFAEGANDKLYGGLTRGVARGTDAILPGVNTGGLEKFADDYDPSKNGKQQFTSAGKAGEKFGSAEKGVVDLATIVLPQSKIDKLAESTKIYKTLKDGSKIMQVGGKMVKVIPGSVAGTVIDDLQQRGRGDKSNLTKSAAIGIGTDLAVDSLPGGFGAAAKLFKRNAAKQTVDDVVEQAVGAGATATTQAGRVADNALTETEQKAADALASQAAANENALAEKGLKNATDEELSAVANNDYTLDGRKKDVQEELNRRKTAKEQADFDADPLNKPAYQVRQEADAIVKRESDNLDRYVNENPGLTPQQIDIARNATQDRIQQLTDDLVKGRTAAVNAVEGQTAATGEAIQAGQAQVAEAAAKTADQVAPPVASGSPAPQGSPELIANDAYNYADRSNAVLDAVGETPNDVKRGNVLYDNPLSQMFFKTQQKYIEGVDATRAKINEAAEAAIKSENGATKGVAEVPRMFFKNFGQSDKVRSTLIKRTSQLQNSGRVATTALKSMEDSVKAAGNPAEVYERIYRVLEDPEFLQRAFGDATKLTPADLSPAEREAFDKLVNVNKIRNDINFQTGVINREQHAAYQDGMHSPRVYDINVEHPELKDFVGSSRYMDLKAGIKRKDIKDVPDYVLSQLVDSPFQASALRLEGAMKNLANHETLQNLDGLGGLPMKAPNSNFVPLTGKKYGQYEGRFIDKQLLSQIDGKDYYNSEVGQKIGDAVDTFHNSALGAPGRVLKKFRTTLSPGTIVGNLGSGQFAFSGAANINPLTSMFRTVQATKQLNKSGIDGAVQEAELAGLFAGDTGRMITHTKEAESAIRKGKGNAWDKANNFYGGIDKATSLGWYNEFRARGLSPEQAVARVHLGMQNYGNSGRVINALSDSPILGKPFARFTPELVRIAKNAAVYNPVGTAAKGAGLYAGANYLSENSGETSEERSTRENAVGQTSIPTSLLPGVDKDISLNLPVGDHSVNIARAIGLNFPQEPNGDPKSAIIKALNPVADLTRTNAQGETVIAPNQAVGDMFYRQIADQVANRDFMGREITDPTNKTYYEDGDKSIRKFAGEPSAEDQRNSRLRNAAMNLPFASEVDNLQSTIRGKEDFYGKERSVPESIGRLFGVKIESNDQKARDKRVDTQQYFDEDLPAIQKFVTENPDLAQAYYKIKNPTRGRTDNTKVGDVISPEKWDIINSDTSGRLAGFFKDQEQRAHDKSVAENAADPSKVIKPIDPLYSLPEDQQKYVTELRSRPSGDDEEAKDILRATSGWYKQYEQNYFNYLDQNSKYFDSLPEREGAAKENARVKEYGEVSTPVAQPPIIEEYLKIKAADPDKAKEVYKANKDALSSAFDKYAVDKLDRINKQRKIEGYDPISLEVYKNKTFGFNIDDGTGSFGSGGSKRNPEDYTNNLGELTNFSKTIARPDEAQAATMPQIAQFFNTLNAGSGGSRRKPTIGASSRGA